MSFRFTLMITNVWESKSKQSNIQKLISVNICWIIAVAELRDNWPMFMRKPNQRNLPREALLCRAM